ncbi:MAG: hypothetical protein CMP18_00950 [Rickettsiales bacterium]|nr:hypothetical protein [Rickettsiales bacterium]
MKLSFNNILSLLFYLLIIYISLITKSFANDARNLPIMVEASEVSANNTKNIIIANGNVEVTKGNNKLNADKIKYNKSLNIIEAFGDITMNNSNIGIIKSKTAQINEDFNKAQFKEADLLMFDGSYFSSNIVDYNKNKFSILTKPKYSFCPNEKISKESKITKNSKEFALIESDKIIIDNNSKIIKTKNAFLKIYDVPIIYIPYLVNSMPSKKKKTGFLFPSYTKSSKFGLGVITPFYVNISQDKDLLITPKLGLDLNKANISSNFRHETSRGSYNIVSQLANNKILQRDNDITIKQRNENYYRWSIQSKGDFSLSSNSSSNYDINLISDSNFLRDYQENYLSHITSQYNYNFIKDRDYLEVNIMNIRELENSYDNKSFISAPSITYNKQFKPLIASEKISIKSNITSLSNRSNLEYNRFSVIPKIEVPYVIKGSLLKTTLYSKNDFYKYNMKKNNLYSKNQQNKYSNNNSTAAIINWSLPLVKKTNNKTLIIEPLLNFKSTKSSSNNINIDSDNSELGFGNIFSHDYYSGYDRNENGNRVSYGVSSSIKTTNNLFKITLGQAYKSSSENLRGFDNDNKSDYVGRIRYDYKKNFNIEYFFQIDNNNYSRNLDEVDFNLNYKNLNLNGNYLAISNDKINLNQNLYQNDRRQISLNSSIIFNKRWNINSGLIKNLDSSRVISKHISLNRDGCCTNFGIYIKENNPENFIRSEKTYGLNFTFKNL